MKYRKLRIVWSVAWGVVAILLCVLWARSVWWMDKLVVARASEITVIESSLSQITYSSSGWIDRGPDKSSWRLRTQKVQADKRVLANGFSFFSGPYDGDFALSFPHWCPILTLALLACLPWFPYRFSLRTLLIGTTLVAVLLGLVVYLTRK